MTNEERTGELVQKAKESYEIYSENKCVDSYEGYQYIDGYCNGYEQGYEDCRHYAHNYYKLKWHDLRKNPNDLPKRSGEYWCKWEDGAYSTEHYFGDNGFGSYVIAWCELPKFKE